MNRFEALTALRGKFPILEPGHVWLVGAGPGDPGLLTLNALAALAQADVVVHDALIDRRVLALADAQAQLEYAGKRGGQPSTPQTDIFNRLIALARAGRRVVRLKGGDPFVFGRGGEEAEALAEAGVPFEVVPGVSAAIAVPACAGIPVTHRSVASSFAVVTGHDDPEKRRAPVDWAGLATAVDTLVVLMGQARIGAIARELIAHGRSADTPVALISAGTTEAQRVVECRLADAGAVARAAAGPLLIVIGEVVRLRDRLGWLDSVDGLARMARAGDHRGG